MSLCELGPEVRGPAHCHSTFYNDVNKGFRATLSLQVLREGSLDAQRGDPSYLPTVFVPR